MHGFPAPATMDARPELGVTMTDRPRGAGGWTLRGPELLGIVLIVVGVIAFLGSTNIVQISWNLIWPVLVIAVGAAVLLSALRPHGDATSGVQIPRDGADQLELDLTIGAGEFHVAAGGTSLVEVHANQGDVQSQVDRNGSRRRVRLRQDSAWFPFLNGRTTWDVLVAGDVPTALTVQAGAGSFELDLSAMRIVDARMTFGAADARVTLPTPSGEVGVRLSGGAASITIRIPPGVAARVQSTGGLMSVTGRTETPGYATARDRVNVTVSGGASSVRVV